jgi:septum formation protein
MIILASLSPRRRELMKIITEDFTALDPEVDEGLPEGTSPEEGVKILALRKAERVARMNPGAAVVGADTVVALGGAVLGKPRDEAEAAGMLRSLSGREHIVYTGVAVVRADAAGQISESEVFAESTAVRFRHLLEAEIAAYIQSGEPMDKAGAYGIQDRGALFVSGITGDYFNVVGLPLCTLAQKLGRYTRF